MPYALILSGPDNLGAGQVASALRRRGTPVLRVSGEMLEMSRWEHRVENGLSHSRIHLPDGKVLDASTVGVVLNQLRGPTVARFAASPERDRTYAMVEWESLLLAWLSSWGSRVIGCPSALDWGVGPGAPSVPLRWQVWARHCGLGLARSILSPRPASATGPDVRSTPFGRVESWTVVSDYVLRDDRVVGGGTAAALQCLARLAEVDLLGITLCRSGSGDEVMGVDLRPPLSPRAAEIVAGLLADRCAEPMGVAS